MCSASFPPLLFDERYSFLKVPVPTSGLCAICFDLVCVVCGFFPYVSYGTTMRLQLLFLHANDCCYNLGLALPTFFFPSPFARLLQLFFYSMTNSLMDQSSKLPSGRNRRTMMGIFRSRSSFCAIFKGSVSPAISTMTGAFKLI
jgi:hypothetical protein